MFNILVAPNSFKECKDAISLSVLIENSLQQKIHPSILSKINLIKMPISDGGDGFLMVCNHYFKLNILTYDITTPWGDNLLECIIGYLENKNTAFIESATVLGLNCIPLHKRDPLNLNSRGMGDLIKKLQKEVINKEKQIDKLIIGIGGTGTNDLGLGALEPFNLKLFDKFGKRLKIIPENYNSVADIEWNNIEVVPDYTFSIKQQNGRKRSVFNYHQKLLN